MSLPRVDVCDPTDEGTAIVDALRARSLLVTEVAAADLGQGSDAALVVLAAEADGALEVLAALRVDATSITPVLLLGSPPGRPLDRASALALGADAWLARPVPVDRLVRKVETFLAPADARLHTVPAPSADPPPSFVPPERTMRLDGHADDDEHESDRPSSQIVPLATGVHEVRPRPEDEPNSQPVGVSPALRELLARADRRAFPDDAPLDVDLAVGDEPPEVLVPPGVLDDAEDEMSAQGALDAVEAAPSTGTPAPSFATGIHAGTPSPSRTPAARGESELPPVTTSAARKSALPPERRSVPARVRASTRPTPAEEELPGDATSGGRGRAGTLGPVGGLALLFRIAEKRLDVRVRIETPELAVVLGVRHGEVRSIDGPIAERALARLSLVEHVRGEDDALAALERRVAAGVVSAFARERAIARAREEVLADVLTAPGARFEIASLDAGTMPTTSAGGGGPRPFRAALPALLVELARARLDVRLVKKLLGAESVRLVPTPRAEDVFVRCALAPELAYLLAAREGLTLDTLLAETAGEPGVAGIAYALVAAGALVATPLSPGKDLGAAAAARLRREVQEAAARAEESDYFAILGLPHDAGGDAVRAAHASLSRSLAALPLTDLGQPELEPLRAVAVDALDEALSVLGDDTLRARYAAALA